MPDNSLCRRTTRRADTRPVQGEHNTPASRSHSLGSAGNVFLPDSEADDRQIRIRKRNCREKRGEWENPAPDYLSCSWSRVKPHTDYVGSVMTRREWRSGRYLAPHSCAEVGQRGQRIGPPSPRRPFLSNIQGNYEHSVRRRPGQTVQDLRASAPLFINADL